MNFAAQVGVNRMEYKDYMNLKDAGFVSKQCSCAYLWLMLTVWLFPFLLLCIKPVIRVHHVFVYVCLTCKKVCQVSQGGQWRLSQDTWADHSSSVLAEDWSTHNTPHYISSCFEPHVQTDCSFQGRHKLDTSANHISELVQPPDMSDLLNGLLLFSVESLQVCMEISGCSREVLHCRKQGI